MAPQLPYPVPLASSLYVADYDTIILTTPACTVAGGSVTIATDQVDQGEDYAWLIDQMAVACTSTTATALGVYIGVPGNVNARQLAAGTRAGNSDFDDVSGVGLLVRASEAATFVWTNCSVGAVGNTRVQIRKLRQTSS